MNAAKKFGRYVVERPLGAGAMGEVFLARDPQIERLLALKTLKLEGVADKDRAMLRDRLLFEAKAAGQLVHPNVVTLFDTGEEDGVVYLAFEYVEGCHLGERVEREPRLTLGGVLRIAREVASALDLAQTRGIVHRDIKPSNILLDAAGTAKVADFGIAKMRDRASDLTVTGAIIGTPHYMSPEQIRADPLDGRSDVFSLGAVLFELLHRERPFRGDTITTLVYQILHHDPEPQLRLDLPAALHDLLCGMLAKEPEERVWAAEVVQRLDQMLHRWPEELLESGLSRGRIPVLDEQSLPSGSLAATSKAPPAVPPPPPGVGQPTSAAQPATVPASGSHAGGSTPADGTVPLATGGSLPVGPGLDSPTLATQEAAVASVGAASSGRNRAVLWVGGCLAGLVVVTLLAVFVLSRPIERWLSERRAGRAEETQVAAEVAAEPGEETDSRPAEGSPASGDDAATDRELTAATAQIERGTRTADRPTSESPGAPARARTNSRDASPGGVAAGTEVVPRGRTETSAPPATAPAGERPTVPPASPGTGDRTAGTAADPPTKPPELETTSEDAQPEAAPSPVAPDQTLDSGTSLTFEVTPEDAYILFRRVGDRRFVQVGQVNEHAAGKRRTRPWDLPSRGQFEMILRAPGKRDVLLLLNATQGGETTIKATLQPGQPGGASPP